MEQIYRKNSLGGVSIAYQRMLDSGYFSQFDMQTLELERITHGIDIGVIIYYKKNIHKYVYILQWRPGRDSNPRPMP